MIDKIKKIGSALVLAFLLFSVPLLMGFDIFGGTAYVKLTGGTMTGTLAAPSFTGTTTCPTNYTRYGLPCLQSTLIANAVTIGTACTTIPLNTNWGVPSTAKVVLATVTISITSGTVAGAEQEQIVFYSDSGCTTTLPGQGKDVVTTWSVYSPLTSAGTNVLTLNPGQLLATNGATTIYAQKQEVLTTGAAGTVTMRTVVGFWE